jgi:hypothetical protein
MVPLTVTAQPLSRTGPPGDVQSASVLTYTFRDSAWSDTGYPFSATGTALPHAGLWKVTAQAGDNWGCFVLGL